MRWDMPSLLIDCADGVVAEVRQRAEQRAPARGPQNLDELLAARAARGSGTADSGAVTATAHAAGREVSVRIIVPHGPRIEGVVLDIHGGGFYLDSAQRNDVRNREIAERARVAVVSVDYPLSPEFPWPAAPDACETAALWLIENAVAQFGTAELVIVGRSAGATLAATTLLRMRDRGLGGAFAGAVAEFGTYDLSATTPAGRLIADEYFLDAYLGSAPDRTRPDVSPIFGTLIGLPPTLIVVGEADVLLSDNLHFASRLAVAGVDVELNVYPQAPHGFTSHPTMMAELARRSIDQWIAERLRPASTAS